MITKTSWAFFIFGVIFGFFLKSLSMGSNIYLNSEQLEELSETISANIYTQFSSYTQRNSDHQLPKESVSKIEATDELVEKLKSELALVIADELRLHREEEPGLANGSNDEDDVIVDNDYEQYHQARAMLYDAENGAPLTFHEFVADPKVQALPKELRDKLMGEVAMKLTAGELNPDVFLGTGH